MSPMLRRLLAAWPWALAAGASAAATWAWGWRGLVMALSVAVFVMLLQLHQGLRVMQRAGRAPVGRVPSAVALQARLHTGMSLLAVLRLTGSLGQRVADEPTRWAWADAAGDTLTLVFVGAKLRSWALVRAAPAQAHNKTSGAATPSP
jgi:hypothetical protein